MIDTEKLYSYVYEMQGVRHYLRHYDALTSCALKIEGFMREVGLTVSKQAFYQEGFDKPFYNISGETGDLAETQAILHVKNENSDVEAYVLTVAGKLSLCGMNNYGVAVCCNTVSQLSFDPKGLAEDFIVRTILEKKSAEEAIAFLKSVPHASGQNYLVGDPNKIVMVECGQNKVVVIEEHLGNGRFIHTNHPLVNDDTEKWDRTMALARAYAPEVFERLMKSQTT